MESANIIITTLILAGGVIMMLAIVRTRRIFKLMRQQRYRKNWHILFYLMIFFFVGYLAAAIVVVTGHINLLALLTGIVFLFGAAFVYIVVMTGWLTINDLKEKTDEANRSASRLNTKNKELEQFAYITSHDLKEPLRNISSLADLLEMDKTEISRVTEYVSRIKVSTSRMLKLIDVLLKYSRIGRESKTEAVNCNQVVDEVIEDLNLRLKETNSEVNFEDLPIINANAIEIKQLFQNLITNSIKFSRDGIPPQIDISATKNNEHWLFYFRDNGIGIPDKHKQYVFEIFQRLHDENEYEGTGIGLTYCKKIVESHGGTISVESKQDQGSTFIFTLPA